MALADEIKLRYSNRFIRQITNPDVSSALTIDDARLTRASDEAESIFKRTAQQTFDLTDTDHLSAIVPLVIYILQERADQLEEGAEMRLKIIMEDMKALADFTVRAAVAPRGFRRGEITFECKTCGAQRSIVRWEAASQTWTGLRYPSWASRGDVRTECEVPESTQSEIAYDRHDDMVEFRVPRGNNAAAVRFGIAPGEIASCNGLSINEENAVAILDRLMDPNSRRIRFQSTQLTGPSSFIVPGKP